MTAEEAFAEVLCSLRRLRVPAVVDEVQLHRVVGERLTLDGIAFRHEVVLGPGLRVDFLTEQRITGRETVAQKSEAVRAFAAGESKAAVVALRTAAGIDGLQRNGTVVVFPELDWSPAIHAQCEDRLNRMGMDEGLDSTLCYYLVADAGSDATMMNALGLKVGQFVGLMGDTTESEEDRDLAIRQAERHMQSLIDALSKGGR